MKNLTEFKRRLKVGVKIDTVHHWHGPKGIREIALVQKNSFALKTVNRNGEVDLSHCILPPAKNIEFNGTDSATIFLGDGEKRKPVLTYTFI